jgi:hypothetical protein
MTRQKLFAFANVVVFIATMALAALSANAACMFRVNGWEPTDEGLLLSRYAAGVSGPALLAGTRYVGRDPAAVFAAFESVRLTFDMNGDSAVDAIDATIVLRYTNGYRGVSLTQGLNLGGGSRNTLSAIEAFIESGCVAPISSRAPIYEALSYVADRNALLSQADAQGARSYLFLSPIFVGVDQANLYVNDTPGVFSYRSLDTPATLIAFATQLNTQGAERYRFEGVLASGSYFVRDENSNRTYSYRLLATPDTANDFLTQANAQGVDGYYFLLPYFIGGASYMIYEKESGSSTYAYALQPSTEQNATPDAFVTQANTQGANGYKFRTSYQFGDGSRNVYVKDTSQSATFAWKHNPNVTTVGALVTQANSEGANAYAYLGARVFFPLGLASPSETRILYFKPMNCLGSVLCSPRGPF